MAKTVSWILGVVLVVAGVWGFFSQPAAALGFIAADTMSSVLHLILGLIVLAMAGKPSAGMTLKVVGIIYVIWSVLGFFDTKVMAADSVTNWFYLIVGVVVAAIGFMNKGSSASSSMPMNSSAPQM